MVKRAEARKRIHHVEPHFFLGSRGLADPLTTIFRRQRQRGRFLKRLDGFLTNSICPRSQR
jgi:hypothetical protein